MSRLEEMDKPRGKKRRLGSEGDLESGSINLRKVLNESGVRTNSWTE